MLKALHRVAIECVTRRLWSPVVTSAFSNANKACTEPAAARLANSVVEVESYSSVGVKNEPILEYKSGSEELQKLEEALKKFQSKCEVVPIVVNGKDITTSDIRYQVMPHRHQQKIAEFYYAGKKHLNSAIHFAAQKQKEWDSTPLESRIAIWERAADLMAGKYRADLVAATMLGQGKTVFQAEIDAAVELIDFTRMNVEFLKQATKYEPISVNPAVTKNHMRFRGLDGFVAAISPFNFTAIGGNMAYTPALMGNAVLWKPSDAAILSSWIVFKIMREAGLPDGVVNFVPADGPTFSDAISFSDHLTGINFTGSVPTLKNIYKSVIANIEFCNHFPRIVGECGGKNFHFMHASADVESAVALTIRSAFEYSGQKCSACSRLYVPESLWESKVKDPLVARTRELIVGDVCDYDTFLSAVIDTRSMRRVCKHFDLARASATSSIITGARSSNLIGHYVDPTIIVVNNPQDLLMKEEIFGPVLAVYVYKDSDLDNTMDLVINTTNFALTGSVFATDEKFLRHALEKFKYAAGNFYINDKSTGAIVGQQPFGGSRLSGTNDKAGGPHYILRWTSPQTIKETFVPLTDIYYPYMKLGK